MRKEKKIYLYRLFQIFFQIVLFSKMGLHLYIYMLTLDP